MLPQLLEGVDYRVDYEIDPETGAHSLVWLGAGRMASQGGMDSASLAESAPSARTRGESPAAFLERHRRRVAGMSPEERARIREEWNERAEALRAS